MSELKPCPFCGQKDEHLDDDTEKGFDALIFRNGGITCEMCLGRGPLNLEEELARKKWNTRPASPALDRLKEEIDSTILKACETEGFAFQRAFVTCLRAVVTRPRPDCNEEQAQFWMSVATEAQKKEAFDDAIQILIALPNTQ